jgi:hypothetical protein
VKKPLPRAKPPPLGVNVLLGPTIKAGESLSDTLDCSIGRLVRITMPLEWTTADITFQISSEGVNFNDVHDQQGRPVAITGVAAGSAVIMQHDMSAVTFMRIRSGYKEYPVVQAADRQFAVAVFVEYKGAAAAEQPARSRRR